MHTLRVQLPSRGKFGPSHVNLRNPRIADIREFLSFTGKILSARTAFVQAVCQEDISGLLAGDRDYLFVNLRRLVNPSDVSGSYKCDGCDSIQQAILPYEDIEVRQLPDDFRHPTELVFPVCKDPVCLSLVTVTMENDINDYLALVRSADVKEPLVEELDDDLELYARYAVMLQKKDMSILEKMKYLDSLDYADFEFIMAFDITFTTGPLVAVTSTCEKCEQKTRVSFPLDSDFLGMSLHNLLQKHRFLAKAGNIGFNDFLSYTSHEADSVVHEEIELRRKIRQQAGKR